MGPTTTVIGIKIEQSDDLFVARSDDLLKMQLGLFVSAASIDELQTVIPSAIKGLFKHGLNIDVDVMPFAEPDAFLQNRPLPDRFSVRRLAA